MVCLFQVIDFSAAAVSPDTIFSLLYALVNSELKYHLLYLQWLNHGAGITNSRSATGEVAINRVTVSNLRQRWTFQAGRDISATPAIANGIVYFPSWNGNLYAVNAFTGTLLWKQNLGELTGLNGTGTVFNVTVSRATPTVAGDRLIVGIYGPGVVIAVNRFTGRLIWSTQLDPHPCVQITMSGTIYMG